VYIPVSRTDKSWGRHDSGFSGYCKTIVQILLFSWYLMPLSVFLNLGYSIEISHCGSNLHFSEQYQFWVPFHTHWPVQNSLLCLYLTNFILSSLSLSCWFVGVHLRRGYKYYIKYALQISSPSSGLPVFLT